MPDDDWTPMRVLGTYTRSSPEGTLIETYHDGYQVNETGAFIWSLVGSGSSVCDIAAEVTRRYGVDPARGLNAVRAFLSQLRDRGFIE
jgi:Coenzyme PQQ synthesis protein D (PqqD)